VSNGFKGFIKDILNYRDPTIFFSSLTISAISLTSIFLFSMWGVAVPLEIQYTGMTQWWLKDGGCVVSTLVFFVMLGLTALGGALLGLFLSDRYGSKYFPLGFIVAVAILGLLIWGLIGTWWIVIIYNTMLGADMTYLEIAFAVLLELAYASFLGFVLNNIWR
jgi:hypothetical protein